MAGNTKTHLPMLEQLTFFGVIKVYFRLCRQGQIKQLAVERLICNPPAAHYMQRFDGFDQDARQPPPPKYLDDVPASERG
jgi:hypothetical protein